jgi:4-hydroxy-tetrahydrodipicolinate reductase
LEINSMSDALGLIVHGAAGRMGQRVVALAAEDPQIRLVGAIEHAGHPALGQDAMQLAGAKGSKIPLACDWPPSAEVVIDFSIAEAVPHVVQRCQAAKLSLVLATTGFNAETRALIASASRQIPIVWSPSMSLAVNLTMRLAQQAAAALKDVAGGVDIEIIERHHRFKADAPSGTALKFGELIVNELDGEITPQHGRSGVTGQRSRTEIGYHAIRAGDDPGQHTILFGMMGETLELRVAASNRDCYASGAIAAAKWLRGKPPGLYNMFDVLGLGQ